MNPARRATKVVVVGGGIAGAFSAYFLARSGADVTLVERTGIGAQASGNNPGGLIPLYGPHLPGLLENLALDAFRLHLENWGDIGRLSGLDFRGREKRRVNLAIDDADIAPLTRMKESYDATPGFSARWLDRGELLQIEPRLDGSIVRALWTDGDRKVSCSVYTRAIVRAANALGATIVESDVRGVESRGDRVTDVLLDSGRIACDGVVIATGPWCEDPARWLDVLLPVEPVKGQLLLVEAEGGGVRADIAWRDTEAFEADGRRTLLGGSEERVGFDRDPSDSTRSDILDRIGLFFPAMGRARVVEQSAGLRPITADQLPIIGAAAGWSNVCLVLGGGRKGMLLSAAMGRAAADLLTGGETELPIHACTPDRFAESPATMRTS